MTPHTPAVNAAGELLPEQPKSVYSASGDLAGSYAGAAHTTGPWWVAGKGTIRHGGPRDHGWVADVHWINREANARLIAAAPDLLAALDYVIRDLELRSNFKRGSQKGVVDIGDGAYMQAKAALAAATGRAVEAPSSANQQMDPESSAALATQGVQL